MRYPRQTTYVLILMSIYALTCRSCLSMIMQMKIASKSVARESIINVRKVGSCSYSVFVIDCSFDFVGFHIKFRHVLGEFLI